MRKRNVLLITIDSLRADHLGCYGYHLPTSPFLDSIANQGTYYDRAYATGPTTPHSFPGILAHAMPFELPSMGVRSADHTLAEVLRTAGYSTAAFNEANPFLLNQFGYGRGFDRKEDYLEGISTPEEAEILRKRSRLVASSADRLGRFARRVMRADSWVFKILEKKKVLLKVRVSASDRLLRKKLLSTRVLSDVEEWLSASGRGDPFFLWVHFMTTHFPYYSEPRWLRLFGIGDIPRSRVLDLFGHIGANIEVDKTAVEEMTALYDASIRQVDSAIEQLYDKLVRVGSAEDTIIAVISDHGEEFLDHGELGHRSKMFDELVRVPWILLDPARGARRVPTPVSLLRLDSELLCAAGVESPFEDLNPLTEEFTRTKGLCCFQAYMSQSPTPRGEELSKLPVLPKLQGCVAGRWKGMFASVGPDFRLFDWVSDPGEKRDYAQEQSRIAEAIYQVIQLEDRRCEASRLRRRFQGDGGLHSRLNP